MKNIWVLENFGKKIRNKETNQIKVFGGISFGLPAIADIDFDNQRYLSREEMDCWELAQQRIKLDIQHLMKEMIKKDCGKE